MARGIKDEPYSTDSQERDLGEFKSKLTSSLRDIEDPRASDNQTYQFESLIGIIMCAITAGANGISDIYEYAVSKQDWLREWLDIGPQVPSYMAFWWLLVRLDPSQSEQLFRNWLSALTPSNLKEVVAIDGKRVRGASKKSPGSLLHMVSAWSSAKGLILGQLRTEKKSNEITAIPKLIDSLDIADAVITSDAMGCQTEIVKHVVDKGAGYVLGLKGNQQTIHDEVTNFFEQARSVNFEGVIIDQHQTLDKGHGRIEERNIYATSEIDWLSAKHEWPGLNTIVMIESRRTEKGKTTSEIRYYISSLKPEAKRLAFVIRSHWGIENQVHWILDVIFAEDECQVSTGNAAENLSILRRLSLNMLRLDSDKKSSLRAKRKKAGWNNSYLKDILNSAAINSF